MLGSHNNGNKCGYSKVKVVIETTLYVVLF